MKTITLSLLLFCIGLQAQVGIGNTDPKATLDITSTTDGLLIPRVALTSTSDATTVVTLTTSELVYNTATAGISPNNVVPGYYYWNGTKWVTFTGGTSNDWSITGNSGTTAGTNFLGTTDDVNLIFKRNNIQSGLLDEATGNTAFGVNALTANIPVLNSPANTSTGAFNTAIGVNALIANTSGTRNTAIGAYSMEKNTTGQYNTAVGRQSFHENISGSYNMAIGQEALLYNTTGDSNSGIGFASLKNNAIGSFNLAMGRSALSNPVFTGSGNIGIGFNALVLDGSANNQMNIGWTIFGTGINSNVTFPTPPTTTSLASKIGILNQTPTSTLDVKGSLSMQITITPLAVAYTALDTDYTIIANGNITLPAPASTNLGRIYVIYLGSSTSRTISSGVTPISNVGSDVASLSMINLNTDGNYRGYTLQSNGTKWVVIGKSN